MPKILSSKPHRECITVVIPTLLKCPAEFFDYTLGQLNSNDLVKEIIVIDNTEEKSFDKTYSVRSKIIVIKEPGNQGASYNLGMQRCSTEYYLLVNDDVACRSTILDSCFDIMEQDKSIGLLQINTAVRQPLNIYLESDRKLGTEYLFPVNPRSCMTGWFQFGRKEDWIDIPKELKFFYGDDLMLEIMRHKNKKVARIISDYISHMESSTVGVLGTNSLLVPEGQIYQNILRRMFPK